MRWALDFVIPLHDSFAEHIFLNWGDRFLVHFIVLWQSSGTFLMYILNSFICSNFVSILSDGKSILNCRYTSTVFSNFSWHFKIGFLCLKICLAVAIAYNGLNMKRSENWLISYWRVYSSFGTPYIWELR